MAPGQPSGDHFDQPQSSDDESGLHVLGVASQCGHQEGATPFEAASRTLASSFPSVRAVVRGAILLLPVRLYQAETAMLRSRGKGLSGCRCLKVNPVPKISRPVRVLPWG